MTPGAAHPDPNDRLGIVFAIAAASALGLAIAVSRTAYEGGTNGLTVATTRASVLVLGLLVVCLATGRRLRIGRRDWLHCAGLGTLTVMMFYGNVGSVEFISVGLAALLFYTFPPIVAVIQIVVLRDPPSPPKLAALVVAFSGLAIMLGVSLDSSDPRGVALALGAGVAAAWNTVWLVRKVRHLDTLVVTFHMASIAAIALVAITWSRGAFQPPITASGWIGLWSVVVLQCSGVPLYFLAIPRVGAIKSAMLSNVQPVVSIVAAWLMYAEILTPVQFVGGMMVLGGIWFMQLHDARRSPADR